MTAVVDARTLQTPVTGVGRHVQLILEHVPARLLGVSPPGYDIAQGVVEHVAKGRRSVDAVWNEISLAPYLREHDAYWAANSQVPWRSTKSCRIVSSVHDLVHRNREARMPPGLRLSRENAIRASMARADVVVSLSEEISHELGRVYGRRADLVIPCGPTLPQPLSEDIQLRLDELERAATGFQWVLMVGSLVGRKNHARVRAALEGMPRVGLIAVGPDSDPVLARALTATGPVPVVRRGFVSSAELASWYAAADVFAFPSLSEGLGLPLLDARHLGCRIVTSDRDPMRSAGGTAATLVDPLDVRSIERGVRAALALPRPAPEPLTGWRESAHMLAQALDIPGPNT